MDDLAATEDRLIETVAGLGLFRSVQSAGRDGEFKPLQYPAAAVVFMGDGDTGNRPRAVWEETYAVLIRDRNLSGEQAAARGVYALLQAVREAIHGKTLGLANVAPFACLRRELTDYDKGLIDYQLTFTLRRFGGVPSE